MIEFMNQYVQSVKDEKTRAYSPWTTAFDQMALKTVIKRCLKTAPLSSEDLRNGYDESDPQEDPRYAWASGPQTAQNVKHSYVHPLLASDDMFQPPRTIDAEYESREPEAQAPKPEPEPQPTTPPPDQDQAETQRLEMLEKLKDLIRTKKITSGVILEKTGMPASMIERAGLSELVKIYAQLK